MLIAICRSVTFKMMRIATTISFAGGSKDFARSVVEMEKAGLDQVWVGEAYGFDSPSLMGYLASLTDKIEIGSGIMPIYYRSPALIAMTAAGIDALSDGRFNLGLGSSGPQVVEGWHGVPFDAPIARTREIIDICHQVWAREAPLRHDGRNYHLPLSTGEGTGSGKPLRMMAHPLRPRIPVWLASLGHKNVAMAAEIAEGWLPIFFQPEKAKDVWGASLALGAEKRDPSLAPLEIAAGGILSIGEGEQAAAAAETARPFIALHVGGGGARGHNFYNDLIRRYGYEREADVIQDLYLAGKKDEAAAAVPEELIRLTNLCGPASWVKERIAALREAGVTCLKVDPRPTGAQSVTHVLSQLKELAA